MLDLRALTIEQDDFVLTANFSVESGRRIGILGASGAGKSTFLSALGGFIAPKSGSVIWREEDLTDLSPAERPAAHVFQDNNLFPHMTAAQNVGLGIKPSLRLTADDKARVSNALADVGLGDYADRKPAMLSGGQQSRVALARLLVQRRPLILLDEPFSALGPAMRADMIDLACQVGDATQATVFMVSHDIEDIKRFSDDVIWIGEGLCLPPRPLAAFLGDPPRGFSHYAGT